MAEYKKRLQDLRKALKKEGLDGFIVPRADRYGSKYPAAHDERLHFLSGFTGSAGNIALTLKKAIVMTDARYAITIKQEVDPSLFATDSTSKISVSSWFSDHAKKGSIIGFDPLLHSTAEIKALKKKLKEQGITLKAVTQNPIDYIWQDQPPRPVSKTFIHDIKYAGQSAADKRRALAEKLQAEGCEHYIMTATDVLCWMLNIRGRDTHHSPTVQCSAIFNAANGHIDLFINQDKLDKAVKDHLGQDVTIHDEKTFERKLKDISKRSKNIGYDAHKTPYGISKMLKDFKARSKAFDNPATLMKAKKNDIEQENLRLAHLRDSLAWVKFLHWVDTHMPAQNTHEMDLSDRLDAFRKENEMFDQHGYGPIAGWAENGANIHYHSTGRGAPVTENNLFLIDSGAQSLDGQTDITRAILIGHPTHEMIERYTLVLKGHIKLAKAVFPEGTTGTQLDTLARQALWERGLNYPHGTGHGIGFYLDVHEGPCNISPRAHCPLEEGMLLSNEPGYYKEGHYGIRLENEILVQPYGRDDKNMEQKMLHFETITFVPFDRRLIDTALLSADELGWLNRYHSDIYHKLADQLDEEQKTWLKNASAPLPPAHKPPFKATPKD